MPEVGKASVKMAPEDMERKGRSSRHWSRANLDMFVISKYSSAAITPQEQLTSKQTAKIQSRDTVHVMKFSCLP